MSQVILSLQLFRNFPGSHHSNKIVILCIFGTLPRYKVPFVLMRCGGRTTSEETFSLSAGSHSSCVDTAPIECWYRKSGIFNWHRQYLFRNDCRSQEGKNVCRTIGRNPNMNDRRPTRENDNGSGIAQSQKHHKDGHRDFPA